MRKAIGDSIYNIIIDAKKVIAVVKLKASDNKKDSTINVKVASSNQIMGVRKTTNFVEKATWVLAIVICVLSILSSFFAPSMVTGSRVEATPQEQQAAPFQTEAPAAQQPAAQQAPAQQAPAQAPAAQK